MLHQYFGIPTFPYMEFYIVFKKNSNAGIASKPTETPTHLNRNPCRKPCPCCPS